MADIKYQIFISSTYADLVEERQAVSRAILDMGHIPAGMEMFPAADTQQLDYIKKVIDECDYYALVMGARYGSLDPEGISFTEREYDYAVATGKTVLAFIHKNPDEIALGKTDKDNERYQKLVDFKAKVCDGRLVKMWSNADELASQTILSLTNAFSSQPQVGWVRANTIPSDSTVSDILLLRQENDKLQHQIKELQSATEPEFNDAADLSTEFTLRYRYLDGGRYQDSSVIMTYEQFLRLAAPALHIPASISSVESAVEKGLQERHGARRGADVLVADVQDALLHLVACGVAKMWEGKSKEGVYVTGYKLTPHGVTLWKEMSYVKR